ncbi:MAG TPA: DUF3617 domain-containing protein [Rhizomicrobium sp.]
MSAKAASLLLAAALLLPGAALAAHGKAGLWSSTTTMTMPGMPAQSRAATYCMTQAEVASEAPAADPRSGCVYKNMSVQGRTYNADMVCTGQFKGTGRFSTTYDSDTHYTATIAIAGEGFSMTNAVEGKWLKADCAGATQ